MALNNYFQNQPNFLSNEQNLFEDLVNESIQIRGHDVYYIVRESRDSIDFILGEDPTSKFDKCYKIEMYVKDTETFTGQQDILSKFGVVMDDNMKFIVASRAFEKIVPAEVSSRPSEGDLIYSPLFNKLFEITFAKSDPSFYVLGRRSIDRPFYWELSTEAFKYSHEQINTGIDEIDNLVVSKQDYTQLMRLGQPSSNGSFTAGETVVSGNTSAVVADWNIATGALKVSTIIGDFAKNTTITGTTSNTYYTILDIDKLGDAAPWNFSDNETLESEANTSIDHSETNPFGLLS